MNIDTKRLLDPGGQLDQPVIEHWQIQLLKSLETTFPQATIVPRDGLNCLEIQGITAEELEPFRYIVENHWSIF